MRYVSFNYSKILADEILYIEKAREIFSPILAGSIHEKGKHPILRFYRPQVAIIMVLQRISNSQEKVIVANTHLVRGSGNEEVRLFQIRCLLEEILQLFPSARSHIILCGDLNSPHGSNVYRFLDGQLSMEGQHASAITMRSAYSNLGKEPSNDERQFVPNQQKLLNDNGEPQFTCFRVPRGIDFIFYTDKTMRCSGVLELVNQKEVRYMPSGQYPSDHIALLASFTFAADCMPTSTISGQLGGFDDFDRRSITLLDGTKEYYYALPSNYEELGIVGSSGVPHPDPDLDRQDHTFDSHNYGSSRHRAAPSDRQRYSRQARYSPYGRGRLGF